MEENYNKERKILERYRKGEAGENEQMLVEQAFNDFARSSAAEYHAADEDGIGLRIWNRLPVNKPKRSLLLRPWARIAVAASLAAVLFSAGLYFYNNDKAGGGTGTVAYTRDILPGKKGATLTLSSGKRILLADMQQGTLASEAGVRIVKDQSGELTYELIGTAGDQNAVHTLSTTNGETQRIRLQDGSIVYLNAASSLSYPASFAGMDQRRVELKGEGYFEIAKDPGHPFIVNARGQSVQVLGTHFNINAYENEPAIKTALFEGSVRLASAAGEKVLAPGQEAVLKGTSLKIEPADQEETLAWKNDRFVFNDETLESIMRKVERWYDVEVIYDGVDKNDAYGGSMTRNENISAVLQTLAMTEGVRFRIEGRKVHVLPAKKRQQ